MSEDLVKSVFSYELDPVRYKFAESSAEKLLTQNITVTLSSQDMFKYERKSDEPHLFFIDLEGICAFADFHLRFGTMFQREVIKSGDTLFITSYLGRNKGWTKLFADFDAEFRILGISDPLKKETWYRRAHPSFTLFKGLYAENLQDELSLKCIGCVQYRDTSTMAIYGYKVELGKTAFASFVRETPYFNMKTGEFSLIPS